MDLSPPNETPTNFAILKDDTLESLCIKLLLFRIYQNALREWILYIGKKYRKFQKLDMAYVLNDRHGALDLEDALVQMINSQQWTDLKTYNMKFFPLTEKITQAMDKSEMQLESMILWCHSAQHCHLEQQLKSLEESRQIKSIRYLQFDTVVGSRGGGNVSILTMPSFSQITTQLVTLELHNHDNPNPYNGVLWIF